jgi:hypothetical protein
VTRPGRLQLVALTTLTLGLLVVAAASDLPLRNVAATPGPTATQPLVAEATPTAGPTVAPPTVEPLPSPTPTSIPTPEPTPVLVAAPLTGRLVPPEVALQYPIAVMVDDHSGARPQSGFNSASVVWQAPAEGGIPRYMMVFQENIPASVGPIRSARYYFIAWAADWKAMYVHVGGSPQAQSTLAAKGAGQLVYNADQFRWGTSYFWRVRTREAPHNVYTDGPTLRKLARTVKAVDRPLTPAWTFGPDAPLEARPSGGRIEMAYLANRIRYDYDRASNTYVRSVTGASPQIDAADGQVVAPKNVVVMVVRFAPLNDGSKKHRLEAQAIGRGTAWIATNGRTIKGTWRKTSLTSPTVFFDAAGKPVTLTVGQTFVEVLQASSTLKIADGAVPPPPSPTPSPTPFDPFEDES